jgi:maltooligosyltrehalose trehalohydrolase
MKWQPSLGAWPHAGGTRFRVWAPEAQHVDVVVEGPAGRAHALAKSGDGTFAAFLPDVHTGDRYRYRVDDKGPFPDPVSRFQPEGVHGPSQVIDPTRFAWSDAAWPGRPLEDLIIYELHVGTFTPAGTYAAVIERLPQLVELGVTAIELLPVADFPGERNWGYDGVSLFAPARCYGTPDDLRRLVDAAHRAGLAVIQDVVYNHLGPDGNYLGAFSPYYFSAHHKNAWGASLNFDGPHSERVREFFLQNALHWVHEYHVDGLRLDATHAIRDEGRRHFLAELSATVHTAVSRPVSLMAEDDRNRAAMVYPEAEGGWGLDALWADDFHHQVRRLVAGDHEGYYGDFTGTVTDLAATIRQGWFYCGQRSAHANAPRGSDPGGMALPRFVICIQNHDQVGNRALGERLHHQIDRAAYRAATALLLLAPETPLLFMGQEWAASTPFQFFTDHRPELGRLVTEGRRKEFQHFSAFADPKMRERIPDPQAATTFEASKLNWDERGREPHASILRLYQALLQLRRHDPALRCRDRASVQLTAYPETMLTLRRQAPDGSALLAVFQFGTKGPNVLPLTGGEKWEVVLTTEDARFSPQPNPPTLDLAGKMPAVKFAGPAAVILRKC